MDNNLSMDSALQRLKNQALKTKCERAFTVTSTRFVIPAAVNSAVHSVLCGAVVQWNNAHVYW